MSYLSEQCHRTGFDLAVFDGGLIFVEDDVGITALGTFTSVMCAVPALVDVGAVVCDGSPFMVYVYLEFYDARSDDLEPVVCPVLGREDVRHIQRAA